MPPEATSPGSRTILAMKCIRKARGSTIVGVIIGVGLIGSSLPTASHFFAQRRAQDRLDTIVKNLAGIDMAVAQWSKENHGRNFPVRENIDGSGRTVPRVAWPVGPVAGTYSLSNVTPDGNAPRAPRAASPASTFDGGVKGPMNRLEWQKTCSSDPVSCGL